MHLLEHFSDEGVGRASVIVRNVTHDLLSGGILQNVLERLERREVAAPDDLVRRRRTVGCGGDLADLRPLQAERSPGPLDGLGVPREVVALVELHVPLVSDRHHTLVRHLRLLQTVGRHPIGAPALHDRARHHRQTRQEGAVIKNIGG
jgi:hypothetical protein